MKNKIVSGKYNEYIMRRQELPASENSIHSIITSSNNKQNTSVEKLNDQAEILFITSYPPRECGIATYSQDLIKSLNNKFSNSLSIKVCALESGVSNYAYPGEVKYILDTNSAIGYDKLALNINDDDGIRLVLIQHEFGFFRNQEQAFLQFLYKITKPVAIVFHTVLPNPDKHLKTNIKNIAAACESIIVMTRTSSGILINDYGIKEKLISVIAHGTHLVPHLNVASLKLKYGLKGRKVLSTFGLLSSGKSIETTIEALPAIVSQFPEVIFLVIGKTHPEVAKTEGEKYREMLEFKVKEYSLEENVIFVNKYLALPELLEYLQLTDIYLFTSNDPNQAVSGTFAYAMSCSCPIISTPIPHAKEVLTEDTGIIFDFRNSDQLADNVIMLLKDDTLRRNMSINTLQKIVSTAWENSAVEHAMLFKKLVSNKLNLQFNLPAINLDHLKEMTTKTGIIQFSKVNQPDLSTGYTLDDNARALIASCMYLKLTGDKESISDIQKYLSFIKSCQQPNGNFLNYMDQNNRFTGQNRTVNLDDSNGRAIWALGYLISLKDLLSRDIIAEAEAVFNKALLLIGWMHSSRAMAFAIKGIYYHSGSFELPGKTDLLKTFADRLVQMYRHESGKNWEWFESYLTYANSILPEAMLYAWQQTGEEVYKDIALSSFKFLLSQTFNENGIEVISNKNWFQKGQKAGHFGEQPIDVAYTIMTLSKFYEVFKDEDYLHKMETAFNWFLGSNRLHQIIYNPCTGGCYDGLEETNVNLNQGAESTVSYLMARFTMDMYKTVSKPVQAHLGNFISISQKRKKTSYSTQFVKYQANPGIISLPLQLE